MKLEKRDGGVLLHVKVVPNSSRTQIAGMLGDAIKIKVAQPPEDGKANAGVERLIAETLGIAPARVSVVSGHTKPRKQIRIVGMSADDVLQKLGAFMGK